jgi:hypothetical protein
MSVGTNACEEPAVSIVGVKVNRTGYVNGLYKVQRGRAQRRKIYFSDPEWRDRNTVVQINLIA